MESSFQDWKSQCKYAQSNRTHKSRTKYIFKISIGYYKNRISISNFQFQTDWMKHFNADDQLYVFKFIIPIFQFSSGHFIGIVIGH